MIITAFVTDRDAFPHRRRGSAWPSAPGQPRPEPSRLAALLQRMREAYRLSRSRKYLARLDDHGLKDIGVSRAEAEHEINKPFWRC